ncbi:MAG: hypothetical protein FJX25_09375 [Alphaproteobacteria bacterium]|nr:hypothetical protein [Alphaproteobacteria bacterium]
MPNVFLLKDLSQDELALLVSATAAYQHHSTYKALHDKLVRHQLATQKALNLSIVPMAATGTEAH